MAEERTRDTLMQDLFASVVLERAKSARGPGSKGLKGRTLTPAEVKAKLPNLYNRVKIVLEALLVVLDREGYDLVPQGTYVLKQGVNILRRIQPARKAGKQEVASVPTLVTLRRNKRP